MSSSSSLDPLSALGGRLRARRKVVGLSLRALAARLDISPSALSQIETSRSQPSVGTLYEIARALDMPLDRLFVETDGGATPARTGASSAPVWPPSATTVRAAVQRASGRPTIDLDSGVSWELLTVEPDPAVDFLYVSYPPRSCSSEGLLRHPGREYGLVLEGTLTMTIEAEDRVLEANDSIDLDSRVPHRLRNDGDETACAVWVVLRGPGT